MPLKLAVSNIAWPPEAEAEVFGILERHGVVGVEIAPTKLWQNPTAATTEEVARYRQSVEARGLRIVAAQALLFGKPELTIFEDRATRADTLAYLEAIVRVCAGLGAEALVFGSPKNRRVGSLPPERVSEIAIEFFTALAGIAEQHGTAVVLEANPPAYGADFVTKASEAAQLVREVNRPGLRLHLDSACMSMAGDNFAQIVREHSSILGHAHISEPNLAPVCDASLDHHQFAESLKTSGYDRWVSIEMRAQDPFDPQLIDKAIAWAKGAYGID